MAERATIEIELEGDEQTLVALRAIGEAVERFGDKLLESSVDAAAAEEQLDELNEEVAETAAKSKVAEESVEEMGEEATKTAAQFASMASMAEGLGDEALGMAGGMGVASGGVDELGDEAVETAAAMAAAEESIEEASEQALEGSASHTLLSQGFDEAADEATELMVVSRSLQEKMEDVVRESAEMTASTVAASGAIDDFGDEALESAAGLGVVERAVDELGEEATETAASVGVASRQMDNALGEVVGLGAGAMSASKAMDKMGDEAIEMAGSLKLAESQVDELGDEAVETSAALQLLKVSRGGRGLVKMFSRLSRALGPVGAGIVAAAGGLAALAAAVAAAVAVFTALHGIALSVGAALGGMLTARAAEFGQSIKRAAARTRIATSTVEQFSAAAIKMSAKTTFGAMEAAEALEELGRAGFSTQESMNSLKGTLDLAAIAGTTVARAAETTTGILRSFNVEAKNTSFVMDILAEASTNANTSIDDLGLALGVVGSAARRAGVPIQNVTALIANMQTKGLSASRSAIAVRRALAVLQDPTSIARKELKKMGIEVANTEGKFRGLIPILQDVINKADEAGAAARVFGVRAGPTLEASLDVGSRSVEEFAQQLLFAGGKADRLAGFQFQNLKDQARILTGSLDTLAIVVGRVFSGSLIPVFSRLNEKVNQFRSNASNVQEVAEFFRQVLREIKRVVPLMKDLGSVAFVAMRTMAIGIRVSLTLLERLRSEALEVKSALNLVTGNITAAIKEWQRSAEAEKLAGEQAGRLSKDISALNKAAETADDFFDGFNTTLGDTIESTGEAKSELEKMEEQLSDTTEQGRLSQLSIEARKVNREIESLKARLAGAQSAMGPTTQAVIGMSDAMRKQAEERLTALRSKLRMIVSEMERIRGNEKRAVGDTNLDDDGPGAETEEEKKNQKILDQIHELKLQKLKAESDVKKKKLGITIQALRASLDLKASREERLEAARRQHELQEKLKDQLQGAIDASTDEADTANEIAAQNQKNLRTTRQKLALQKEDGKLQKLALKTEQQRDKIKRQARDRLDEIRQKRDGEITDQRKTEVLERQRLKLKLRHLETMDKLNDRIDEQNKKFRKQLDIQDTANVGQMAGRQIGQRFDRRIEKQRSKLENMKASGASDQAVKNQRRQIENIRERRRERQRELRIMRRKFKMGQKSLTQLGKSIKFAKRHNEASQRIPKLKRKEQQLQKQLNKEGLSQEKQAEIQNKLEEKKKQRIAAQNDAANALVGAMSSVGSAAAGALSAFGASAKATASLMATFEAAAAAAAAAKAITTGNPQFALAAAKHGLAAAKYGAIAGKAGGGGGGGGAAPGGGAGESGAGGEAKPREGDVTIVDFSDATLLEEAPTTQRRINRATEKGEQQKLARQARDG